jgi:nucleoid DNA-binding protein
VRTTLPTAPSANQHAHWLSTGNPHSCWLRSPHQPQTCLRLGLPAFKITRARPKGGWAKSFPIRNAMNKADLIEEVQKNLGAECSKAHAERVVSSVLASITKGLKKDKEVQLVGFGTFAVKSRKARMGRNPQTNQPIQIKASRTVGFRAGTGLKTSV